LQHQTRQIKDQANKAMNTKIISLVSALALSTSLSFGYNSDVKVNLPASTPVLETPAPEASKMPNEYNKYTPAQKAAIVELKLGK
jgi:hypothetical protein